MAAAPLDFKPAKTFDKKVKKQNINNIELIENDDILALGGDEGSAFGTGGMRTKLHAAQICTEKNCDMIIANGEKPDILYDIVDGKAVGTRFIKR